MSINPNAKTNKQTRANDYTQGVKLVDKEGDQERSRRFQGAEQAAAEEEEEEEEEEGEEAGVEKIAVK